MLLCVGGFSVGFMYKDNWLGIHIYFVPSMSMYPTLKPGQFIVVDTWAYLNETPEIDDVVVFANKEEQSQATWLVKRIGNSPDQTQQPANLWYMLGDNQASSHDSRYFGGIPTQNIIGQVKLILVGIDSHNNVINDSTLQVVK